MPDIPVSFEFILIAPLNSPKQHRLCVPHWLFPPPPTGLVQQAGIALECVEDAAEES